MNLDRLMEKLDAGKIVAGLLGLTGGGWGYIKFHLLGISWGDAVDKLLQLSWSCLVAFCTAAIGIIGKKIIEDSWPKLKLIFKRKKRQNGSN